MINFYRRFLPAAAKTQAPLHALTLNSKKKDQRPIQWNEATTKAFKDCKTQLANAALLAHPADEAALVLSTDASSYAIGAVLEQECNGLRTPLGFFSRKLTKAQVNYSTYDRELLAVYESIQFFRYMIEGRNLTIRTDQKLLTYALQQKPEKASPRQQRQLSFISQFISKFEHIAGKDNVIADTLSRVEAIQLPVIVSTDEITREQLNDEELKELLANSTSLNFKKLRIDESDTTIYCNTSNDIRIYIPATLRRKILDVVHKMSHPGIKATRKLISRRFIWPSINKDVASWVRTCLPCQRSKIQRHNKLTPEHIQVPADRSYHVHLDIVGPLPSSKGHKYCLTMIDRRTRWPEAAPITDTSVDTVATAFFGTWIARYGAPAIITTDRGSQFESLIFDAFTKLIGADRIRTTAYHSQSNGMIERWHRSLKTSLKCHAEGNQQWTEVLPTVLLGLRTSFKEDIKASAVELVLGTTLRIPGEYFASEEPTGYPQMFTEKFRNYMRLVRATPTTHHTRTKAFIHKELENCTHVFVRVDKPRRPLNQPYEGPFPVIQRLNRSVYRINFKGQTQDINVDRLKPAFLEVIQPEPQGTPATSQASIESQQFTRIQRVTFAT